MALYLIEGVLIFLSVLFIVTQVIFPLFMGRPFFPIFRRKPYLDLAAAKEKEDVTLVYLETSDIERRVAEYLASKRQPQGGTPNANTDEPVRQPGEPEDRPKGPDITSN